MLADTAFRAQNGANTEAVLLTIFSTVAGFFSNQVGVGLELARLQASA